MAITTTDRGQTIAVGRVVLFDELSSCQAEGISAADLTLVDGEVDLTLVQPVADEEFLGFVQVRGIFDGQACLEWVDPSTIRLHNFDSDGDEDKTGELNFLFFRLAAGDVPVEAAPVPV